MVNARVALAADRNNNLAASRMERIKDLHFNRRTPGIMTLVRQGPERPTSPWGSAWPLARKGSLSASPPPPRSSTN